VTEWLGFFVAVNVDHTVSTLQPCAAYEDVAYHGLRSRRDKLRRSEKSSGARIRDPHR